MVTSPMGNGVIVIGGRTNNVGKGWNVSNVMFELKTNSMEWIQLNQTLQQAMYHHLAIPIPDDLTYNL